MSASKIAITIERDTLTRLDRLVRKKGTPIEVVRFKKRWMKKSKSSNATA